MRNFLKMPENEALLKKAIELVSDEDFKILIEKMDCPVEYWPFLKNQDRENALIEAIECAQKNCDLFFFNYFLTCIEGRNLVALFKR